MRTTALCIAIIGSFCLAGCTVKADRTECACLLRLNTYGSDETLLDYDWEVSGNHEKGRVCTADTANAGAELEVSRGRGTLKIWNGIHSCYLSGNHITVPYGFQMDEVYTGSANLDTRCDLLSVNAQMHRQHAFIYLDITGSSSCEYPYTVSVCGNSCGFDLSTLEPLNGPFRHLVTPVIGETHRVCVPRQMDCSLSLEFNSINDSRTESSLPQSIPIGRFIEDSGYDWDSEDLSDIYLKVDFSQAEVSVNVLKWDSIEENENCQ